MTDFSDFTSTLKEWANREDWSPALVTSFVRDAESKFNMELRIDRMIRTEEATIISRCAPLPDDWLEFDFVRIQNDAAPTGFQPIDYKPRAEFFTTLDRDNWGHYTIEGRQLFIGGFPDSTEGQTVRIDFYGEVPVFSDDTPSWVYTKHQAMYRYAALINADLHAQGEENQASQMKQLAEDMINKLNTQHRYSRASGSRLQRTKIRSFG